MKPVFEGCSVFVGKLCKPCWKAVKALKLMLESCVACVKMLCRLFEKLRNLCRKTVHPVLESHVACVGKVL